MLLSLFKYKLSISQKYNYYAKKVRKIKISKIIVVRLDTELNDRSRILTILNVAVRRGQLPNFAYFRVRAMRRCQI